jgi:hypothetical protein
MEGEKEEERCACHDAPPCLSHPPRRPRPMLDLERGDDVEEERERGRRRPKAGFRARADGRATTLWLELRPRRAPPTPARMCRTEAAGLDHGSPLDGAGGDRSRR